jgi:FAD/FMN-containing dehydrogenase
LSLRRLNDIEQIDRDGMLVSCGAGVILQNLHDAVAAHGLRFPLTLGGKGSATVGGLVSTNAGGTQVLRHGAMRNLVAGVEAVLPDGSVFDGMAPLKKDNRGYDVKHLLIGAEGTIGIVTRASLRLVPALLERSVSWAAVAHPDDAYRLLLAAQARCQSMLEGFEILPDTALGHVLLRARLTLPGETEPTSCVCLAKATALARQPPSTGESSNTTPATPCPPSCG